MFGHKCFTRRVAILAACFFLFTTIVPRTSGAISLHWSSGATDTNFVANTRCILVVQADSAEVTLPSTWRFVWAADSSGIQFVSADSVLACQTDTANVSSIDPPSTPADSAANEITAHFCSAGSTSATRASFRLDLVGASQGKLKVVALDPTDPDSSRVIESNEATFNGGIDGSFPPAVLRAYITHPGGDLSVTAIGSGLASGGAISLTPADTTWRLPMAVTERSDNRAVAAAYLGIPVPSCNIAVAGASGSLGGATIPAEVPPEPLAPIGSSAKFVPAYGIVQPKDFAFYYQQQLGLFHLFYIIDNRVIRNEPGYGEDATERCLGHAWSTDLVTWHNMDSVLTVRSGKWDNLGSSGFGVAESSGAGGVGAC